MKLIPYDKAKIEGIMYYKKTDNLKILEEFASSGLDCAKVDEFSNKSAFSCANSLNHSIKRYKFAGIHAISRRGNVYLIKE